MFFTTCHKLTNADGLKTFGNCPRERCSIIEHLSKKLFSQTWGAYSTITLELPYCYYFIGSMVAV